MDNNRLMSAQAYNSSRYASKKHHPDLAIALAKTILIDVKNHNAVCVAEKSFYSNSYERRYRKAVKNAYIEHCTKNKSDKVESIVTYPDLSISYHKDDKKFFVLIEQNQAFFWLAIKDNYTDAVDYIFDKLVNDKKICLIKKTTKKGSKK